MAILADLHTSEPITESEHEVLSALLKLLRHQSQWVPDFLDSLKRLAKPVKPGEFDPLASQEFVIFTLIQAYFNEPTNENCKPGVLTCLGAEDGGYEEMGHEEFQELSNYLTVIRDGGWLARRISSECTAFAKGKRYTPGEVIQHITGDDLADMEASVAASKKLLEDYPQLFKEHLRALTPEPPKPAPATHAAAEPATTAPTSQPSPQPTSNAAKAASPAAKPAANSGKKKKRAA